MLLRVERIISYILDIQVTLRKRLEEHNKKLVKSTKSRATFDLVYYEAYASIHDAKNREKQLKKFSGLKLI